MLRKNHIIVNVSIADVLTINISIVNVLIVVTDNKTYNSLPGGGKKNTPRQHRQNLTEKESSYHQHGMPCKRVLRKIWDTEIRTGCTICDRTVLVIVMCVKRS